ncbi:MAG: PepSY domain-containing protein [Leptotrichiaceae bacterium]|nr:PepSY domain-containing protein [Leptotrichiaceae bacterium]MBP7100413.1 PepSY domain-containing protein [Leptotrichiaceae bacterium]MBP7739404.1 PepSY domain-containing protein [Leptotrichiaceae bacterium]MBP9629248.1 PepSY domain-containing protein [Leptotrichiaceae bacterium]
MKNKFFINSLIRLSIILSGVTIFFSVSNAETKARKSIKLSDVKISIEKLKELAFKHSKVEPKDARITKIKLDKENKKFFYEMEFFTEKRKYEYNIDADTGKILSYSQKVREIVSNTVNIEKPEMLDVKMNEDENKIFNPLKYISEDEVKEIIIKRITGSKKENIIRLKLDDDDGKIIYEGRMVYQNTEYNFKLDALTGEVISWEVNEK